jgi:hypothetical protein
LGFKFFFLSKKTNLQKRRKYILQEIQNWKREGKKNKKHELMKEKEIKTRNMN